VDAKDQICTDSPNPVKSEVLHGRSRRSFGESPAWLSDGISARAGILARISRDSPGDSATRIASSQNLEAAKNMEAGGARNPHSEQVVEVVGFFGRRRVHQIEFPRTPGAALRAGITRNLPFSPALIEAAPATATAPSASMRPAKSGPLWSSFIDREWAALQGLTVQTTDRALKIFAFRQLNESKAFGITCHAIADDHG
jgi:hypothetical protein